MSAEDRGLARLMLRFPKFRNRFERMQDDLRFRSVCGEYDQVWDVMSMWSHDDRCAMFSLEEYGRLAASIEKDAITMAEAASESRRHRPRGG